MHTHWNSHPTSMYARTRLCALDVFHSKIIHFTELSVNLQGQVVTTIGFLKEAPHVDVHGFNVYYKNRLILVTIFSPFFFWSLFCSCIVLLTSIYYIPSAIIAFCPFLRLLTKCGICYVDRGYQVIWNLD